MKKWIFLIIGVLTLGVLNGRLMEEDRRLVEKSYRGREGMTQETLVMRLIGAKKAGAGLLWVDQVVVVGDNLGVEDVDIATTAIARGSEKISYLDPYFVGNYQFSGSILAFIRLYRRYDLAMDIFQRGLLYNPQSVTLKKYMAGTLAASRGRMEDVLTLFEDIVEETRDDLLINTLAFTYEQAYERNKDERFLERSLYYWGMLLNSVDDRYRIRAEEKVEKLTVNN